MDEIKIEMLRVDEVIPYKNNPRINDDAVPYVANSIREFGFKVPIVIDRNNVIVAGHTRLKAAKQLGMQEVPCIRATDLNDEQVKAFRLADNKVGELAEWDYEKMAEELEDIGIDMTEFGFVEYGDIGDIEVEPAEQRYTKKINIPQYEITGECPELTELVDTSKADGLIEEIEAAEIPEDVKRFLKLAAARHNVFTYKKIAEYYAHASEEIQELMEKSALVIIDYNDAIKNGFTELYDDVVEMEAEDEQA